MQTMTRRSLIEVKARCLVILEDKEIISLVKETSSPSAAYDVVFAETKDLIKAKAARWLAVMRRDYPKDFYRFIGQ